MHPAESRSRGIQRLGRRGARQGEGRGPAEALRPHPQLVGRVGHEGEEGRRKVQGPARRIDRRVAVRRNLGVVNGPGRVAGGRPRDIARGVEQPRRRPGRSVRQGRRRRRHGVEGRNRVVVDRPHPQEMSRVLGQGGEGGRGHQSPAGEIDRREIVGGGLGLVERRARIARRAPGQSRGREVHHRRGGRDRRGRQGRGGVSQGREVDVGPIDRPRPHEVGGVGSQALGAQLGDGRVGGGRGNGSGEIGPQRGLNGIAVRGDRREGHGNAGGQDPGQSRGAGRRRGFGRFRRPAEGPLVGAPAVRVGLHGEGLRRIAAVDGQGSGGVDQETLAGRVPSAQHGPGMKILDPGRGVGPLGMGDDRVGVLAGARRPRPAQLVGGRPPQAGVEGVGAEESVVVGKEAALAVGGDGDRRRGAGN